MATLPEFLIDQQKQISSITVRLKSKMNCLPHDMYPFIIASLY